MQHQQLLMSLHRRAGLSCLAQAEAAKEARLRGPQAFPLERLLAVYWALLRGHVDAPQPAAAEQSAELHMQLATMVELRLLSRVPPLFLAMGLGFRGSACSWSPRWSCACCRGCSYPKTSTLDRTYPAVPIPLLLLMTETVGVHFAGAEKQGLDPTFGMLAGNNGHSCVTRACPRPKCLCAIC